MLPVRRRPSALAELTAAWRGYEERREGLGDAFRACVDAAMAEIGRTPLAGPRFRRDARKRVVRRFPYAVISLVEPQHIEVLAVFHTSRDPKEGPERMGS